MSEFRTHTVLSCIVVSMALMTLATPSYAVSPDVVYHRPDAKVTLNDVESQLVSAIKTELSEPLAVDPWLVDAARRLTNDLAPPRQALIGAGVSDQFAIPLRYTAVEGESLVSPIRALLNGDIREFGVTHFGVGVSGLGAARRIAVVFVRRGATVGRFPKVLHVGDRYLLNGTLAPGYHTPLILVAGPDGQVHEIEPKLRYGTFFKMLHFKGGVGRYVLEVQARDRYGVQVLNLIEVHVAEKGTPLDVPTVRLQPTPIKVTSLSEAEQRAERLVNHSRRQYGLNAVTSIDALRLEARTHSQNMAERGFFGHNSPQRGGLVRRLQRVGLKGVLARENIAIASSPERAHAELLRSPSHMRNILDPSVTHMGIGVHQRNAGPQPVFTFTQIFARLD